MGFARRFKEIRCSKPELAAACGISLWILALAVCQEEASYRRSGQPDLTTLQQRVLTKDAEMCVASQTAGTDAGNTSACKTLAAPRGKQSPVSFAKPHDMRKCAAAGEVATQQNLRHPCAEAPLRTSFLASAIRTESSTASGKHRACHARKIDSDTMSSEAFAGQNRHIRWAVGAGR